MRDNTVNMTEGSPVRLLLAFSVPMLIGNIFQQLYNLVDSVIVGQFVGAQALAAIGATGSITFFFFALFLPFAIAFSFARTYLYYTILSLIGKA